MASINWNENESLATNFVELLQALKGAPVYHLCFEALLLLVVLWLIFFRKARRIAKKLTEKEKQELIDDWRPEPLVPPVDPTHPALNVRVLDGVIGKTIDIDGRTSLNFSTFNFLNFVGHQRIARRAIEAVNKYGVGSCGPRG